jgi:hypothetical protein
MRWWFAAGAIDRTHWPDDKTIIRSHLLAAKPAQMFVVRHCDLTRADHPEIRFVGNRINIDKPWYRKSLVADWSVPHAFRDW